MVSCAPRSGDVKLGALERERETLWNDNLQFKEKVCMACRRSASNADGKVGLDARSLVEHACVNGLAHRSVHFVAKNPVGGSLWK